MKKLGVIVVAAGSFAVAAGMFAPSGMAQSHADYRSATVVSMSTAPCGGSLICDEYVVESADTTYHIRAAHEKHADLLAIGQSERFRLDKSKFVVADAAGSHKERAFTVVSMEPRTYATVRLHGIG